MSSQELVEFINSQRKPDESVLAHYDFLKKVPMVLAGGAGKFSDTYFHPQNGQTYPCYRFPKREACLMAMSYSYELQAKVFDRMTDLENKARIPSLPELLRQHADALEQLEQQTALIEQQGATIQEQKPKAEFHDAVAEAINCQTMQETAKELGVGPNKLFEFLREEAILMQSNLPYQHHIDEGYFRVVMKKYKDQRGEIHLYPRTLVTGKGAAYIQKRLAKIAVPA